MLFYHLLNIKAHVNINEMGALVLFYIKGGILTVYLLEWDISIVNSIFRVYQIF